MAKKSRLTAEILESIPWTRVVVRARLEKVEAKYPYKAYHLIDMVILKAVRDEHSNPFFTIVRYHSQSPTDSYDKVGGIEVTPIAPYPPGYIWGMGKSRREQDSREYRAQVLQQSLLNDWEENHPFWLAPNPEMAYRVDGKGQVSEMPVTDLHLMMHYSRLLALIGHRINSDNYSAWALCGLFYRFETFIGHKIADWKRTISV